MALSARELVFAPLTAEGAVERIVRRLGEAIGAGVLSPGERLPPEPRLAARFGVAPMTLRQALAVLRQAGLLETRRGRNGGSFVCGDPRAVLEATASPVGRRELRELTDWRRAISGEAAALAAARAGSAQVGRLRRSAAAVEAEVGDFHAFRVADARFHLGVAEASGSARLLAAESRLQVELGEVLSYTQGPELARQASQAGHAPLVSAIAEGDRARAREAMEAHAEATHDWVVGLRLGRLA
jgi:GntR family transcriptional regulator, transcriptional repressor for pyruvate dehydrogenase complex